MKTCNKCGTSWHSSGVFCPQCFMSDYSEELVKGNQELIGMNTDIYIAKKNSTIDLWLKKTIKYKKKAGEE